MFRFPKKKNQIINHESGPYNNEIKKVRPLTCTATDPRSDSRDQQWTTTDSFNALIKSTDPPVGLSDASAPPASAKLKLATKAIPKARL